MIKWQRKVSKGGQKPFYTFEEVGSSILRVTRINDGEEFQRDFRIGDRFWTYNDLPVEMISLNPNGGSIDYGYYLIVREVTSSGLGKKTDVSAANQIDKLYLNQDVTSAFVSHHEVDPQKEYIEGAVKRVFVNKYERNPKAREECIKHYKCVCNVCGFDFSKYYGPHGEGFIEVHHIIPLHQIKSGYTVDPIKDLIPVCSNCHSMLHRGREPLTVKELRFLLNGKVTNT